MSLCGGCHLRSGLSLRLLGSNGLGEIPAEEDVGVPLLTCGVVGKQCHVSRSGPKVG